MRVGDVGQGQQSTVALSSLRPGQRLLVEVEERDVSGLGVIRLGGQVTKAILDITVGAGERFWATVKENGANGLLLVRESPGLTDGILTAGLKLGEALGAGLAEGTAQAAAQGIAQVYLGVDPEIRVSLKTFAQPSLPLETGGEQGTKQSGFQLLMTDILELGQLSDNGLERILSQFKQLGLNYEERLWQALKLSGEARAEEILALKNTWKGRLLEALAAETKEGRSGENSAARKNLDGHLQELTGQQLWLLGGAEENAYVLGRLLFQLANNVFQARVAFEGPRQGDKIDSNHCHFGIITETPVLGELGIEAWIHEDSMTLKFFSPQSEILRPFLDGSLSEARTQFARLGWQLRSLELKDWNEATALGEFLQGRRRSGVNVQG